MKRLHKQERLTMRLTDTQRKLIARAAQKVSRERGELIEDSTFAREAVLREAETVLAPAGAAA